MSTFITVLSDSHGFKDNIKKLKGDFYSSDYIVHLGDGEMDMRPYFSEFASKLYGVSGNCDGAYNAKSQVILQIEQVKILCVHGHNFGVKTSLIRLGEHAKKLNCNAVLYGHTHIAKISNYDGVLLLNPGTISNYGEKQTYMQLKVSGKDIYPKIIELVK